MKRGMEYVEYVLFYKYADDVASTAPAHFPAHRAPAAHFTSRGVVEFASRGAAEEFVEDHMFAREWNEIFTEP